MRAFSIVLCVILLASCSTPRRKVFIEPPPGAEAMGKGVVAYKIYDRKTKQHYSVDVPMGHMPEQMVVVDEKMGEELVDETAADQAVAGNEPILDEDEPRYSYLRGVNTIAEMYKNKRYSEALVKIQPLIMQYPERERLFVMQGTLYRKIGEKRLALAAYKKALQLNKGDQDIEDVIGELEDSIGE